MPKGLQGFQKGHPSFLTEESRRRISLSQKGNKHCLGKKTSEITKDKQRIAHLGKKHKPMSDEGRKNMSLSRRNSPNWRGEPPKCIDCGKTLSLYTAKRCYKCRGIFFSKKNHHLWIKDRTQLKRYDNDAKDRRSYAYTDWRKNVWTRDNWKCKINNQDCKGQILAHHILGWKQYPELRYNINNGITLCQAQAL
jgi:hypothetical protein